VCPNCEEYVIDIDIYGPAQLARIVAKVQAAVVDQRLQVIDPNPADFTLQQPAFVELNLNEPPAPDAISYRLECCGCGQAFALDCEMYHGAGGAWKPVR